MQTALGIEEGPYVFEGMLKDVYVKLYHTFVIK